MHPLSIIIAFGFLGTLVAVGALLVVISTARLGLHYSPNPGFSFGGSHPARGHLALNALLLALGLFLVFLGFYGTYNLIWAA